MPSWMPGYLDPTAKVGISKSASTPTFQKIKKQTLQMALVNQSKSRNKDNKRKITRSTCNQFRRWGHSPAGSEAGGADLTRASGIHELPRRCGLAPVRWSRWGPPAPRRWGGARAARQPRGSRAGAPAACWPQGGTREAGGAWWPRAGGGGPQADSSIPPLLRCHGEPSLCPHRRFAAGVGIPC
jgi:hypothetical protein